MCGLIIQNKKFRDTNTAIRRQISDKVENGNKGVKAAIGCHYFQIKPCIAFIRLPFTTEAVSNSYLETVSADIDRLPALIKS